jgi:hypothetical protein
MRLVAVAARRIRCIAWARLGEKDLRAHRHLPVRATGSTRDRRTRPSRWSSAGPSAAWPCRSPRPAPGTALPGIRKRTSGPAGRRPAEAAALGGAEERFIDIYLVQADPDFAGPGCAGWRKF